MGISQGQTIELSGRRVKYHVVLSRSAHSLRVRVGPRGVDVIRPDGRSISEVEAFLLERAPWILDQLRRVDGLQAVRRPQHEMSGAILFRGAPTRIQVERKQNRARSNAVGITSDGIVVRHGGRSLTPLARSLETWLRKQARQAIAVELQAVTARLGEYPARVYVMGQRTKWGNCSAKRNLSFNWRLVLAPDFVLRYLVVHEAVHLALPNHSAKFWLTVQSLCPESQSARQWLSAHQSELLNVNLARVVADQQESRVQQRQAAARDWHSTQAM